ncbi:hypothetical protein LCGC14_0479710 [marine sediment metagenome]|uniref:Uncharacterized protein n=1 Tax=marine sediment metagenome TaxID=412755 RepID=A0A0F9S9S6_9ZZZZ
MLKDNDIGDLGSSKNSEEGKIAQSPEGVKHLQEGLDNIKDNLTRQLKNMGKMKVNTIWSNRALPGLEIYIKELYMYHAFIGRPEDGTAALCEIATACATIEVMRVKDEKYTSWVVGKVEKYHNIKGIADLWDCVGVYSPMVVLGPDKPSAMKLCLTRENNTENKLNVCKSCFEEYPYAEAVVGFECWGCKNGY